MHARCRARARCCRGLSDAGRGRVSVTRRLQVRRHAHFRTHTFIEYSSYFVDFYYLPSYSHVKHPPRLVRSVECVVCWIWTRGSPCVHDCLNHPLPQKQQTFSEANTNWIPSHLTFIEILHNPCASRPCPRLFCVASLSPRYDAFDELHEYISKRNPISHISCLEKKSL